jgi:hypothetical protein
LGTVKRKLGTKEDGAHVEPHGPRDRLDAPAEKVGIYDFPSDS